MSTAQHAQIEQLQAMVSQLGNALLLSERRTSRLEKMLGWATLSTLSALGLILLIVFKPFSHAFAQQNTALEPSRSVEQAIDRLTQNLTGDQSTIGMMGQMIQGMMMYGTQRAQYEAGKLPAVSAEVCQPGTELEPDMKSLQINNQLGFYAKCFFLEKKIVNPTEQHYQQAVLSAISGTAVDLGVLVARVRDDSDLIRRFLVNYVGSSNELMRRIGMELDTLNKTLESVPIMTASVNTMTHQMGIMAADMNSMTHSMGSTMGRMGSWMPW